jgi:hypothetical protein
MELKWLKFGKEWNDGLNLRPDGQLGESGVSSDGKDGEWYVCIQGSKVVAPTCVDFGPFVVDP